MALNAALVAAIFIAASFLGRRPPSWLPRLPGGAEGLRAALWVLAMLLSLPLLIATYRKLEALGMLLGEVAAKRLENEPRATGIQAIIANTVLAAGVIGLGLFLLLMSSTLLPSGRPSLLLILIIACTAALLWRTFVRIYSRAQAALHETFSGPPPPRHAAEPSLLAGLLKQAQIEILTVSAGSHGAGKLIRELGLRTKTGASIVGIDRQGTVLINPGPDEELMPGDEVLLLGTSQQLEQARKFLRHMA